METEVCPRCNGLGHIDRTSASVQFPIGSTVWWACGHYAYWFGYPGETFVPAVVQSHSESGKKVRISIKNLKYKTTEYRYVTPGKLSMRPADSATDEQGKQR